MAPFTMMKFFGDQLFAKYDLVKQDLTGKTVVVVGANVGLGFEAARHFATMSPGRLILACRSQPKAKAAALDIIKTTSCTNIECWTLDLADFSSVSAFADRFEREGGGKLDILLENAGVAAGVFRQTRDGWEESIQVNHLGMALLAFRLLPILSKTPESAAFPRIVVVSSEAHYFVKRLKEYDSDHILNALNDKERAKMDERYYVTKLFNVFFARVFAARLNSDNPVTIDVVNPGFCDSALRREMGPALTFPARVVLRIMERILAHSTEYGSRALVHAALWGTKSQVHGKYLNGCTVEEESDYAIGEEGRNCQERLWLETLDILKKADPIVDAILEENFS